MARRRGAASGVPEILAVREDRSRSAHRTGAGRPCESDVLSVYLEGGPATGWAAGPTGSRPPPPS